MRCFGCGPLRDAAIARTQGKSAGKGSSGTGIGAPAGDARGEDDASIGELREYLRGLTEEIAALRESVRNLRLDFANLKEKVERLERS